MLSRMEDTISENEPAIAAMSFEDALSALESVVRQLEGGEVPLDESITLYERGEALRRHCQARLDAAEARIEKIVAPQAKSETPDKSGQAKDGQGADAQSKPVATELFDAG